MKIKNGKPPALFITATVDSGADSATDLPRDRFAPN